MSKVILGISIILISSLLAFGQKDMKKRDDSSAKSSEQNSKTLSLDSTTNIAAQLQGTLDVKKANVGDEVILKTTKTIRQNGEVILPKGTNLIGKVTEVKQRTKENAVSKIGLVFDRIEGKNLDMPISASIVSITNAAAGATVGDSAMTDISGSSRTTGSTSTGSSGNSSGGLLGGVGSTVGSTVGGVLNTTTQTVGTVANTAGQAVGTTTGTVGRTLGGIQISNSASGSANSSTTLSSGDKNIRLEKGITFNLLVTGQTGN